MAIVPALVPLSLTSVLDLNGVPIPGAQLTLFDAGTTTPRESFADAAMTSALPSPVLADAYGRLPAIFVGEGAYRMILADADGAQIAATDGLPGGADDTPSTSTGGTTIPTTTIIAVYSDDTFDGWLPCNGGTISNATGGGTARANADAKDLFTALWNVDTSLKVLGGRGLTATADWNAGKTIALPDAQRCVLAGVNGMGVAAATGSIFTSTIGAKVGAETVALTTDQMPSHSHTVTVQGAGGHTHTGSTDANGSHTHTGNTDAAGAHTHSYNDASASYVNRSGQDSVAYGPQAAVNQTGGAPNHVHSITLTGGQHSHGVTLTTVADHTHLASEASAGGGSSHNNVQPSLQVYFHIKL